MGDFTMPSLGADMEWGTLSEWRVAPGDRVARGDIIAVVQTEKSDVDVEVFETGVVEALLVEPGTEVAVGTPLARIGSGETAEAEVSIVAEPEPSPPPGPAPPDPTPPRSGGRGHRHASVVLSPLVRQRAQQLHVDPETLVGSGPGGRVTRRDVEDAARPRAPRAGRPAASPRARRLAAAAGVDLATLSGSGPDGAVVARDVPAARPPGALPEAASDRRQSMRTAIARQMARANAEIPHYHVTSTLDLSRALAWLDTYNREHPPGERILPAALLLQAVAAGARAVPELNGWWVDGAFQPAAQVDIGVAISLRGGGLVNPTIPAVDRSTVPETMAALRRIVTSARRGGLRGSDLAPASITVTNLGEQGAEEVIGVIQPPQVALVGIGRIVERVLAVDGRPVVAPTVRVTVSGDHRATDGHAGSQMLATIDRALAQPESL